MHGATDFQTSGMTFANYGKHRWAMTNTQRWKHGRTPTDSWTCFHTARTFALASNDEIHPSFAIVITDSKHIPYYKVQSVHQISVWEALYEDNESHTMVSSSGSGSDCHERWNMRQLSKARLTDENSTSGGIFITWLHWNSVAEKLPSKPITVTTCVQSHTPTFSWM